MALTKKFKDTIQSRVKQDPAFARELLRSGVEELISGDIDTAKALLRDYINATIGFGKLGGKTGIPSKSLMRMFGASGNPQAGKLFLVIEALRKQAGVKLSIRAV